MRKIPNWKAPGPDDLQGYWLNNFTSFHGRIATQLQMCLNITMTPMWLTTGRTALIMKDEEKGKE